MPRIVRIPTSIERGLPYRLTLDFSAGFLGVGEEINAVLRQTTTSIASHAFASVRVGDTVELTLTGQQTAELPRLPHVLLLDLVLADGSIDPLSGLPPLEIDIEGAVSTGTVQASFGIEVADRGHVDISFGGSRGPGATVEVGGVATGAPGTDAEVIPSGTPTAQVLDFIIPRGDKGDKGDIGDVTPAATAAAQTATTQAVIAQGAATSADLSRQQAQAAANTLGALLEVAPPRKYSSIVTGLVDKNGKLFSYTTEDGRSFDLGMSPTIDKFKGANLVARKYSSLSSGTADANGLLSEFTATDGRSFKLPTNALLAQTTAPTPVPMLDATLLMFPTLGQSNSTGMGGAAITTVASAQHLMFNVGILAPYANSSGSTIGASDHTSLVPAAEAVQETGIAAAMETVSAQMPNRFAMFGGAFGQQGQGIAALRKGHSSGLYAAFMQSVDDYVALAIAAGEIPNIPAIIFSHGEANDYTTATAATVVPLYMDHLFGLASELDADIRTRTKQVNRALLFLSQVSNWQATGASPPTTPKVALAQVAAAKKWPDRIRLIGPKYHLTYTDVHLNSAGHKRDGVDWARAWAGHFLSGKPWTPLWPVRITWPIGSKAAIVHLYVPTPPLVIDTTAVTDPNGAKGFEAVDDSGALTITSVTLRGSSDIHLKFNRARTTGGRLRYAYTATAGALPGPTTGPRGCIRDSAAIPNPYGYASTPNWLVTFEEYVP